MTGQITASAFARPLLVATALWLAAAGPVSADHEPARLGLTPVGQDGTYFELTLEPGEAHQLRVEAANFGHEESLARTYAADVYSIVNGGFGAGLFGQRPSGTTLWLTYPTQEFTLGPDDAVVVDFEVEVPRDTPPGEYLAALVIENAEPLRGAGSIAVDQVNRSAIAVAIDVPGPREPALDIGGVSHKEVAGLSVVSFEVDNPGNVHLRPAGEFALRDGAGKEITAGSVAMDSVYAGSSTLLETSASELLAPGDYCAELTLSDAETEVTASTECLPFAIVAPAGEGSPIDFVPGLAPLADAIGSSGPVLPIITLLLMAGVTLVLLAAWRRRRAAAGDGLASDWPAIDLANPPQPTDAMLAGVIGSLRRALHEHPRISRAWIVERGSGFVLAVEGGSGTTPAEAAQLSRVLQERADREVGRVMPMRVVCLSGAGPVARTTADAVPFYVNDVER